jgi:Glycosyltransferase family 87
MAFLLLEEKRPGFASLFIVLSVFIKLSGAAAFVLYFFYPNKIKTALYTLGWFVLLTILPLVVISPTQLTYLYKSWVSLLMYDEGISYGLSVDGWLHSWFHIGITKNLVLIIGIFIFVIPLFKIRNYQDKLFRILLLSSILIQVVVFNFKAESPTYIIAVSGVVFWYFMQERKIENLILLILVFLFTSLSATELFL